MKQRASSTTYLHRLAEYSLGTMYRAEYQLKFTQNEGYNIAKFVPVGPKHAHTGTETPPKTTVHRF